MAKATLFDVLFHLAAAVSQYAHQIDMFQNTSKEVISSFLRFFEDLARDPVAVLERIWAHLQNQSIEWETNPIKSNTANSRPQPSKLHKNRFTRAYGKQLTHFRACVALRRRSHLISLNITYTGGRSCRLVHLGTYSTEVG